MSVTFDPNRPSPDQISPLRTGRFATSEEKAAQKAAKADGKEPRDKIEISQEGRDAVSETPPQGGETCWEEQMKKIDAWLGSMTKDDFMGLMREQLGEPNQLEINWSAAVDPDHTIYIKTYMNSLVSQCKEVQGIIEDYYSDAYQEAMRDPEPLSFLSSKYLWSGSKIFDSSIPANERRWTYDQVRRTITGQRVSLADPYALAGTGLNQGNSVDRIAEKAAEGKIEALIRQAKEAAGVSLD